MLIFGKLNVATAVFDKLDRPHAPMSKLKATACLSDFFLAGSRLSASLRGSMNSCRLGQSERLADVAPKPDILRTNISCSCDRARVSFVSSR